MSSAESVPITCENCGYEWEYTGGLYTTTCPRCNNKTPTPLKPGGENEEGRSVEELEERREELLTELAEIQTALENRR